MNSKLYDGTVAHNRLKPKPHKFKYSIYFTYIDLDELENLFTKSFLWHTSKPALIRFDRRDYHGDPNQDLREAVRDTIEQKLGFRPEGPVRMLTHLKYFGYIFNPATFYYCFSEDGKTLEAILAEVTNTPWKERHAYALSTVSDSNGKSVFQFNREKEFHVSPFMDMDHQYDWRFTLPGRTLSVHMISNKDGEEYFSATLNLKRRELTPGSLLRAVFSYPLITGKVIFGIYWQALRLKIKRIPYYPNPGKLKSQVNGTV